MSWRLQFRDATRQMLKAEPCQHSRNFSTTHQLFAKRAPRPSPRVQAVQRQAQRREDGRPRYGYDPTLGANHKITLKAYPESQQSQRMQRSLGQIPLEQISLPTYNPSLIKEIIADPRIVEGEQQIQDFMKAWEAALVKHRKMGPWQEQVAQKYNISHETLYVLGRFPRKAAGARLPHSLLVSMDMLIEVASQRGSRLATILNASHFLGDPDASKHELFEPYIERLQVFASENDQQCMTILAMLQRQIGDTEKARLLLQDALQWDKQPYTPLPSDGRKHTPLTPAKCEQYFLAITENGLNVYLDALMWPARHKLGKGHYMFPGAVEAMYTLGTIYLQQVNGSGPRTSHSTEYFKEAYTLFYINYFYLRDPRSLKQLIAMTPSAWHTRLAIAEQSAVNGDTRAWRLLSEPSSELAQPNVVGKTASAYKSMAEEWKLLLDYHDSAVST